MPDPKDLPFESAASARTPEDAAREEQARKAFEALEGGTKKAKPVEEKPFKEEPAGSAEDKAEAKKALENLEKESAGRKMAALAEEAAALQNELREMAAQGFEPGSKLAADQKEFAKRIDELKKNLEANPNAAGESALEALEIENALLVDAMKDLEAGDVASADLYLSKQQKEAAGALENVGKAPELKAKLAELGGKLIAAERRRAYLKRLAKQKNLQDEINRLNGGQP